MAAKGETVKKRTLSEAELAARRANAKHSTGPRDTSRTRYNGVKHGLRGGPVLPGESQEAYDRRMEEWMKDHAPTNDSQAFMVTRLVDLSFKIARGDAVEEALGLEQILEAETADGSGQEEVETLAEGLWEDPYAFLPKLRATSAGCLWLLSQWTMLCQALLRHKELYWTERTLALRLLGKR